MLSKLHTKKVLFRLLTGAVFFILGYNCVAFIGAFVLDSRSPLPFFYSATESGKRPAYCESLAILGYLGSTAKPKIADSKDKLADLKNKIDIFEAVSQSTELT